MIRFTCPDCENDTWTAHGEIQTRNRPVIDELRCEDCEHVISPP